MKQNQNQKNTGINGAIDKLIDSDPIREGMNNVEDAVSLIIPETYEKKTATKNSLVRLFFVVLSFAANFAVIFYTAYYLEQNYTWIAYAAEFVALIIVIALFSQNNAATIRMPWMILILSLPIAGILMYLIVGLDSATRRMRKRYERIDRVLVEHVHQNHEVFRQFEKENRGAANISYYLQDSMKCPVYNDTDVEFYGDTMDALNAMKEELRKAEKFIFMEYHAIEDSTAFAGIVDILIEKVREGVEVRVFYDDVGSIAFVNRSFIKKLRRYGIECRVFNPVTPILNLFLNHRDHRKITVIDGKVGFTGGYNIADEYFNITHPYGQWKDSGIKLTGHAVNSLTMMFIEMWNAMSRSKEFDTNIDEYIVYDDLSADTHTGYVQPFFDSPLDHEHVGENVYMDMIHTATDYVWFTTPYLIITDEMNSALCLAAKRGVDVRIITPGIPDKRTIYSLTRSYYKRLVAEGVKIYEYTPGFMHAKQCLVDDKMAVCGTINLDYRSLYHHFENGCYFYGGNAVSDMKEDFLSLFGECAQVTKRDIAAQSVARRMWNSVLRLLSSLA